MRVAARYQGSAGIVNDWTGTRGITPVSDDIYAFTPVGQRAKRLLKKSSEQEINQIRRRRLANRR